uniref:F-box domain-containing protein n=1 Tax=Ditylenchus dipsaci TaxID=166011 RepID=A0A915E742_9BILA
MKRKYFGPGVEGDDMTTVKRFRDDDDDGEVDFIADSNTIFIVKAPAVNSDVAGDNCAVDFIADSNTIFIAKIPSLNSAVPVKLSVVPIDCLYEDVLIEIFQWLPVKDRIRIEQVSKKWSQAAKKSWSNFRCMYGMKWEHLISIQSLRRGGRFVHKLDTSNLEYTNAEICETLSLAPNVKHVKLEMRNEAHVLTKLMQFSSQLKSLSLYMKRKPTAKTLNKLLSKCSQLEHLELVKVKGYRFEFLPSSLKVLAMNEVDSEQLAEVLIDQNIALRALFLPMNYSDPDPCRFLTGINLTKLRHLSIHISYASWLSLRAVADQLPHLLSLDLRITHHAQLENEMVETIVTNMQQLQCLSIKSNFREAPTNFAKLSNLKNLSHVLLHWVGPQATSELLRALILAGKLQYFVTNSYLTIDLVYEAMCKCKCLTHLWAYDVVDWSGEASIHRALDQIFGHGTAPTSPYDPRIRHLFLGYNKFEFAASHPWAVFYQNGSNFPEKQFSEYRVFPGEFRAW